MFIEWVIPMTLFNAIHAYFDIFKGKCDNLINIRSSKTQSKQELLNCHNQLLSDLINTHAKSSLIAQYVSINSESFEHDMNCLFGDKELVKEIIKTGSNLSDYFGYCGFCSDSLDIHDGFSLVIDRNVFAFSCNDVRTFSGIIAKNIRFRKAVKQASIYDPAYQLPTYSIDGIPFNIVPVAKIKYPFTAF